MQIKQVVIWGHKLHTHTHSYIHNGFYVAFKHLNFKTLWLDDEDDVSLIDFTNSMFITEHYVNKRIPCRIDCLYVSHYVDPTDYVGVPKENIIILKMSERDFYEGDKDNNNPTYKYELLNYGQKFEYYANINGYNCLYIYWATDLLPFQIDENIRSLNEVKCQQCINFVGSMSRVWQACRIIAINAGIEFNNYGATFNKQSPNNISILKNAELIKTSIISPALQDIGQITNKYIPCRIFKNISYGKMGMTNNPFVQELFDNKLLYDSNIMNLLNKGIQFEKQENKNEILTELMEIVKNNHTYLNRINTIGLFIKNYTSFFL